MYRREAETLIHRLEECGAAGTANWARGYLNHRLYAFDDARKSFAEAEPLMEQSADYWFDRGRLEFDAGNLKSALDAFSQVYTLQKAAGRIAWPTFRWLATTSRWLGQGYEEIVILNEAMEYPWKFARMIKNPNQLGGLSTGFQTIQIESRGTEGNVEAATHRMATERLPRLLISGGKYQEAIDFIQEWYSNGHTRQAEFSALKVEALFGAGEDRRALEYANHMAERLQGGHMRHDPKSNMTVDYEASGIRPPPGTVSVAGADLVLAAALAHSNQPFSADSTLLTALKAALPVTTAITVIRDDPQTGIPREVHLETNEKVVRSYGAARRALEMGRADLATELLWEVASTALTQREGDILALCLHDLNTIASEQPKLGNLVQEALKVFPQVGGILLEAGRYYQGRGLYNDAFRSFEAAMRIPDQSLIAEALRAEVVGAAGNSDEALRLFRELLARDWSGRRPASVARTIFQPAVRWAEASGQYLRVMGWAEEWLDRVAGGVYALSGAIPIFEAAGRSAFSIGEYDLSYMFYTRAAAAHVTHFSEAPLEINLRDVARNSAMTALAAVLAGRPEEVDAWLSVARSQAPDLEVIELVSALAAARTGDVEQAQSILLDAERTALWAQVARLVAQDCREQARDDLADLLERRADVQDGRTPSIEDLLGQLSEKERRLVAARQEAEANSRYREQTRDVLETLVVRSGLLPQDHVSFLALKEAIASGEAYDPDIVLSSVLEHLASRLQGQAARGDACQKLIGPAWMTLEPEIREQLELAQDYVAYALQVELKDYGPAMMYLAKPIESLLRADLARPLANWAAGQRTDVPWDYAFTLGAAPERLFGLLPPSDVTPAYQRIVDRLLDAAGPAIRRYIRLDWRTDAQELVNARNDWSHRRDALKRADFERLLPRIVGAPDSPTVLGAALALRQILAKEMR